MASTTDNRKTNSSQENNPPSHAPDTANTSHNDDDEADVDVAAPRTGGALYMNQSFISLIANAGSKGNFNTPFKLDSSDDDGIPKFTRRPSGVQKKYGPSSGQYHVRRRKHGEKMLQSMPRLSNPAPADDNTYSPELDPMAESQILIRPTEESLDSHGTTSLLPRISEPMDTKDGSHEDDRLHTPVLDTRSSTPDPPEVKKSLSERIEQIFGLEEQEEVLAEYPCWLLQSVLLRGYMYVTSKHICFYSHLPKRANTVLKSGYISKRGAKNPTYHRYWFVLKGDVLSYYPSPSELYFPRGTIDLRSGILADMSSKGDAPKFVVQAHQTTYHLKGDSIASAKEWVRQIQSVLFRSHNDGDSVKILLPIDNILDIEENPVIDFADTFKIRIIDNDETYVIDEYFFSFFGFGKDALKVLKAIVQERQQARLASSTVVGSEPFGSGIEKATEESEQRTGSTPIGGDLSSSMIMESVKEALEAPVAREGMSMSRANIGTRKSLAESQPITASQILQRIDMFSNPSITHTTSASSRRPADTRHEEHEDPRTVSSRDTRAGEIADEEAHAVHSSSSFQRLQDLVRAGSYPLQKASGLAGMLRNQSTRMGSLLASGSLGYYEKVSSMWAGKRAHYDEAESRYQDDQEDQEPASKYGDRFRQHFSLPDDEKLQATFYCYLQRVVPIYGKMYIGTRKLCFRSLLPGTRTKMILPLKDVENVVQEKGFRFGYSGLVIAIRGHEEIFFEFGQQDARDDCGNTVFKILESSKHLLESLVFNPEVQPGIEEPSAEIAMLENAPRKASDADELQTVSIDDDNDAGSPVIFDDTAASIVNFKPTEPLKITCLTIGSRGDVQPYIALCKGLKAEGHHPTIATHVEFELWIRQHGIDFVPVAGDPAEIMRLCVENDMFTVSFFREANAKFRGWIDELLNSAWKACQGAQVLIESPSAMGGIHIAEALRIPYFRAFTMPWTRTRAYPHAFAVPNQKLGGNYNSFSYVMFDNVFWQTTAGQINRWRARTLGLPSTNLEKLQMHRVPFLYNFSPSVVVPPLDFSHWIRITGYWFLDEGEDYTPPRALADFIRKAREDKKKLVYVGFGSVVVPDSAEMTRTIVQSIEAADVRCVLSRGWSDRIEWKDEPEPYIELPDTIHEIRSAPHDWLFRRMDAAAHHGGAGTTGASLRAGIPTIVKPFFGDQFFFGSRVEDIGVGVCLKTLNRKVFTQALRQMTQNERIIGKAKALGKQIRSEDGVGNAIQAIYRDLEYAKSLIKPQQQASEEVAESEESWTMIDEAEDFGDSTDPRFHSTLLQQGDGILAAEDERYASTRSSDNEE